MRLSTFSLLLSAATSASLWTCPCFLSGLPGDLKAHPPLPPMSPCSLPGPGVHTTWVSRPCGLRSLDLAPEGTVLQNGRVPAGPLLCTPQLSDGLLGPQQLAHAVAPGFLLRNPLSVALRSLLLGVLSRRESRVSDGTGICSLPTGSPLALALESFALTIFAFKVLFMKSLPPPTSQR